MRNVNVEFHPCWNEPLLTLNYTSDRKDTEPYPNTMLEDRDVKDLWHIEKANRDKGRKIYAKSERYHDAQQSRTRAWRLAVPMWVL